MPNQCRSRRSLLSEGVTFVRSYENLQYAFQQLELAAAYYAAGKLDEFICNTGSLLTGDEDFFNMNWLEFLYALADFVVIRDDENTMTSRMYFSDETMRVYFAHAQACAARDGIPLKQEAYYQNACSYVYETLLDACPYCGFFRVVTQTHHEYGYGLSVWLELESFSDWESLLSGLLDIMRFFRSSVEVLIASGEIGRVVPFLSELEQAKEAA